MIRISLITYLLSITCLTLLTWVGNAQILPPANLQYGWAVSFAEIDTNATTTVLVANRAYYLRLQVKLANQIVADAGLTQLFSALGEIPIVTYLQQDTLPDNTFTRAWESTYISGSPGGWFIPFRTGEPGIATVHIDGKAIGLAGSSIASSDVSFPISQFAVRLSSASYTNLLGDFVTDLSPQTVTSFGLIDPEASALQLAVLNPQSYVLLQSQDSFATSQLVRLTNPIFTTSTSVCPSSFAAGVREAVASLNRVLFNTPFGVIQASLVSNTSTSATFRLVLNECAVAIRSMPQVHPYDAAFNALVLALTTSANVYVSENSNKTFAPVLSLAGVSLQQYIQQTMFASTVQLMDAGANAVQPLTFAFLIQTSLSGDGKFVLQLYERYGSHVNVSNGATFTGEWGSSFLFPQNITTTPSTQLLSQRIFSNISTTASNAMQLDIRGMNFVHTLHTSLYVWGNALLYSSDGGYSFFLLRAFTTSYIQSFVASNKHFAFLTTDNQIWVGADRSVGTVQLQGARSIPGQLQYLLFDSARDSIVELSFANGTTTATVTRTLYSEESIDAVLLQASIADSVVCPFTALAFITDLLSVDQTRTTAIDPTADLPVTLFLDKNDAYNIVMTAVPTIPLTPVDLDLYVVMENLDIGFNVSRTNSLTDNLVTYNITVYDKGNERIQTASGVNMTLNPIEMSVYNSTYACLGALQTKPVVARRISLYSGCPPGRTLTLSSAKTFLVDQGCTADFGVPCLFYDNDFAPVFDLNDLIAGTNETYTGGYLFRIVGSGPTHDTITRFNNEQFYLFNIGSASIFTPAADNVSTVYDDWNVYSNSVTWVCAPGSPCGGVRPVFPNTPEYYFVINVTTANAHNTSYCAYTTEFTVRVHGIPMDAYLTILITFVSVGGMFALSVVAFLLYTWYQRNVQAEHEEALDEGEEKREDGEPPREALFG